ncbi:hypothetical protein VP01_2485g2, partial [Puccinia sorghi]
QRPLVNRLMFRILPVDVPTTSDPEDGEIENISAAVTAFKQWANSATIKGKKNRAYMNIHVRRSYSCRLSINLSLRNWMSTSMISFANMKQKNNKKTKNAKHNTKKKDEKKVPSMQSKVVLTQPGVAWTKPAVFGSTQPHVGSTTVQLVLNQPHPGLNRPRCINPPRGLRFSRLKPTMRQPARCNVAVYVAGDVPVTRRDITLVVGCVEPCAGDNIPSSSDVTQNNDDIMSTLRRQDDSSLPVSNGDPMIRTNESPLMGSTCPYISTRARPNGMPDPVEWVTEGGFYQVKILCGRHWGLAFPVVCLWKSLFRGFHLQILILIYKVYQVLDSYKKKTYRFCGATRFTTGLQLGCAMTLSNLLTHACHARLYRKQDDEHDTKQGFHGHCDSKLAFHNRPLVVWGASSTVSLSLNALPQSSVALFTLYINTPSSILISVLAPLSVSSAVKLTHNFFDFIPSISARKLNGKMVIIKASYVAAILSCFLFLQADCGDYLVNISRPWADLDQNSWKYAGTFSAGLQEIGPPALPRNQRFSVCCDLFAPRQPCWGDDRRNQYRAWGYIHIAGRKFFNKAELGEIHQRLALVTNFKFSPSEVLCQQSVGILSFFSSLLNSPPSFPSQIPLQVIILYIYVSSKIAMRCHCPVANEPLITECIIKNLTQLTPSNTQPLFITILSCHTLPSTAQLHCPVKLRHDTCWSNILSSISLFSIPEFFFLGCWPLVCVIKIFIHRFFNLQEGMAGQAGILEPMLGELQLRRGLSKIIERSHLPRWERRSLCHIGEGLRGFEFFKKNSYIFLILHLKKNNQIKNILTYVVHFTLQKKTCSTACTSHVCICRFSWHSHCAVCTVTLHQSLVESILENGCSNNRSFMGLSACQLQAVEQVFFAVSFQINKEKNIEKYIYICFKPVKNHRRVVTDVKPLETKESLFKINKRLRNSRDPTPKWQKGWPATWKHVTRNYYIWKVHKGLDYDKNKKMNTALESCIYWSINLPHKKKKRGRPRAELQNHQRQNIHSLFLGCSVQRVVTRECFLLDSKKNTHLCRGFLQWNQRALNTHWRRTLSYLLSQFFFPQCPDPALLGDNSEYAKQISPENREAIYGSRNLTVVTPMGLSVPMVCWLSLKWLGFG